jgi:hypothetical protein
MPDPNPTIIAMFEYDGRLACEPHAGGGPGEDDRAGFEGGSLGEESDGLADGEDLVSVRREGDEYAHGREGDGRVNARQRTYFVLPFWSVLPLSVHVRGSTCGSGMALLETRQGPRGVVLSGDGVRAVCE